MKNVKTRFRARHSETAKEADRPLPLKGGVGRTAGTVFAGGDTRMSHRARGSNLPMTHLHPDQLGKPHGPHLRVVSRPRGRGTGQGVEDAGGSERRPVIGRIGQYSSRKGADFRLTEAMLLSRQYRLGRYTARCRSTFSEGGAQRRRLAPAGAAGKRSGLSASAADRQPARRCGA